jgi:hypothetical protein
MEELLPPLIGALVGAISALAGVLLTLRHNQRIHEERLAEDRRVARDEREFLAKQDALMSASEAVTRFLTYFISIPDRPLPADGAVAPEIVELGVSLNKLHFYCTLPTIDAATELGQTLNETVGEAMKAKMPSAFLREDLKALEIEINSFERMIATAQEEIRALLFSDPQSPTVTRHREQLSEIFEKLAGCHGRKGTIAKQQWIETEKCREVMSEQLPRVYRAAGDILLLARSELKFPIEETKYRILLDARIEALDATRRELMQQVRQTVAEKLQ